jgi:O-antigen ligase
VPRAARSWRHFDIPVALFLAAALLCLLATEYLRLSLRELRTLIVEPVLFFFLLRATLRTPTDARRLVDVLTMVATTVAALAVAQLFLGGAVTDVQGVRRVHGTYTSPNHLALLLGRALPFLLALAWLLPHLRPFRLAAAALCGLALLLSFSLGGWLGTGLAGLLVVGLLGGRRPLAVLLLAGVLAASILLAVAPVERLAGRLDPTRGTALVRVQLWQAALELIREQPLLGIGLDNFLYRYAALLPPTLGMEPNLSHPHNLVLQAWLQLGLLGVVALGWLLAAIVRSLGPHLGATAAPTHRALAVGALGSMVDFVAHGLVDNSYFLVDMAMIFWLTSAVAGVLPTSRSAPDPVRPSGVQSPSAAPT